VAFLKVAALAVGPSNGYIIVVLFPAGRCAKFVVVTLFSLPPRVLCYLALTCVLLVPRVVAQPCSVDLNFNPSLNQGADIYAVAMQTNGQILIGGAFTSVGGIPITNVARLNSNGTVDPTFNPGSAADYGYVSAIAVQADGKILIGGNFYSSQFIDQGNFARLNSDGSADVPFDVVYVDSTVNAIFVQGDGKIVIGGSFVIVNVDIRRSVARLNDTGALDTSFDACIASTDGSGATSLALQPDGRILASGTFSFSTGVVRNGIARLGTCGEIDADFAPEPGVASGETVYRVALREDGSVLFGGDFRSYHNFARAGLAQLTPDGGIDGDFDPGSGIESGKGIYAITLQSAGQAIIGGNFSTYNGQARAGIARINIDGSLEPLCDPRFGANDSVSSIVVQHGGKVLVGGKFSAFNNLTRNAICRLNGDAPPAPRLGVPTRNSRGQIDMVLYGDGDVQFAVQGSTDFIAWTTITNVTPTIAGTPLIDLDSTRYLHRLYRAISQ